MNNLHGVIFPGGAARHFLEDHPDEPTLYMEKVRLIMNEAERINTYERFFLIWGICLGY